MVQLEQSLLSLLTAGLLIYNDKKFTLFFRPLTLAIRIIGVLSAKKAIIFYQWPEALIIEEWCNTLD